MVPPLLLFCVVFVDWASTGTMGDKTSAKTDAGDDQAMRSSGMAASAPAASGSTTAATAMSPASAAR